jgi:subtilisin-like proprotein convertase family protein
VLLVTGCAQIEDPGFGPDTSTEPLADTAMDTAPDETVDTVDDVPIDPAVDTDPDVPVDTDLDTGIDTITDTGIDTIADTGIDTIADTGIDTIADTGVDTITDTGTDPGAGWGVPVCGVGYTFVDTGAYTDWVTIADLGAVRVMQLDIVINDRSFFGMEIPFDDLVVSLESPTGVERTFWKGFYSDDTGGLFPNYAFPSTWLIPAWWLSSVGGTWTLRIDDTELSGIPAVSTTLASWCLTPVDPATHASTAIGATLNACSSDTGSIRDCDSSGTCPGVTVFEMQVGDIIQATGTPTLSYTASHSDPSQLTIEFTSANGYTQTLWSGGSGAPPSSFALTGMTGEWMTGRYQLRVEDDTDGGTGSVSSWCVQAN